MNIVFLGDVVGRSGREAVFKYLPKIKAELKPDVIIINVENAAGGFGVTKEICDEFFEAGVDVLTSGNHIWDQKKTKSYIGQEPRLLRPLNFPKTAPGKGICEHTLPNGKKVIVLNLMGNLFMEHLDSAFPLIDEALKPYPLSNPQIAGIVVDFHAEATGEKIALAHFLKGRVSFVVGTHTHLPTADAQIFEGGTAFQADAGMCGDYDSAIGMVHDEPVRRFVEKIRGNRFEPALGEGTVCGTFVKTNDKGQATYISPIIIGPRLRNVWPEG